MIYKCVEGFELMQFDENGEETGGFSIVEEDTLWKIDKSGSTIVSGEIHLDCISDNSTFSWIEIPKEMLDDYFEIESEGK